MVAVSVSVLVVVEAELMDEEASGSEEPKISDYVIP